MKKFLVAALALAVLLSAGLLAFANETNTVEKKPFYMQSWSDPGTKTDSDGNKIPYENVYEMLFFDYNEDYHEESDYIIISWNGKTDFHELALAVKEEFDNRPEGTRFINLPTPVSSAVKPDSIIYLEEGVALVKNWCDHFFQAYAAVGGKLDGVALDVEYSAISAYYVNWAAKGGYHGKDSAEGTESIWPKSDTIFTDIVEDERYPEVRAMLEERGFPFWEEDYHVDTEITEYANDNDVDVPVSELCSIYSGSGYAIWNAVMENRMCDYLDEATIAIRTYFPDAAVSNYRFPSSKGWQESVGQTGGFSVGGNRDYVGSTANENYYLRRPYIDFFKTTSKYSKPAFYNKAVYEDSAFHSLQFEMNTFKDAFESAGNGRVSAWISGFNYNHGAAEFRPLRNSPYYAEGIYHIGMMNPDAFLGYVINRVNDTYVEGEPYNFADNMQVIDELMQELTRVAGYADRKANDLPVTANWNSDFVLTGMYSGGRNIWRITPDLAECGTLENFKVEGKTAPTFYINGQTVIFPQGRIIESSTISCVGSCGYWVETPEGVNPVIINNADRFEKDPAYQENFDSYDAGTFTSATAQHANAWEISGTLTVNSDKSLTVGSGANLNLTKLPQNITAGDSYAMQQVWEVDFTTNTTTASQTITLLAAAADAGGTTADGGIQIKGATPYYYNGATYVSFGKTLTTGAVYTAERTLDFTAGTCDYTIYNADGTVFASVTGVSMVSLDLPVKTIQVAKNSTSTTSKIDNLKLRAIGVTTDFKLYDADTGINLDAAPATKQVMNTAYRLSWMNASSEYKVAKIYNDGQLLKEVLMAPGADGVVTGVVEGKPNLSVETAAGTKPEDTNYEDGDFSWVGKTGVTPSEDEAWSPNYTMKFTVDFRDNDGTLLSTAEYTYGQTITAPANPADKDLDDGNTYEFYGWNKTNAAPGECYHDKTFTAVYAFNDSWLYKIKNGKAVIIRYIGDEADVRVPEVIEGLPVKIMTTNVFDQNTTVKNIYIHAGVEILRGHFTACKNLLGVWVDENNPNYSSSEDGALFNKNKTTLLQLPGGYVGTYEVPATVTTIGTYAFNNCAGVTRVVLPDSVTTISNYGFYVCSNMISIVMPSGVTSVGRNAFVACSSLRYVHYKGTQKQWDAIEINETGNNSLLNAVKIDAFVEGSSHTHAYEYKAAAAPTCTNIGWTEEQFCPDCGDMPLARREVAALGHTLLTLSGKAATCTEDGWTEGAHCTVCAEVIVEQTTIPAPGHDYERINEGGVDVYQCAICGQSSTAYGFTVNISNGTSIVEKTVNVGEVWYATTGASGLSSEFTSTEPSEWNIKLDNADKAVPELTLKGVSISTGSSNALAVSGNGALKIIVDGNSTLNSTAATFSVAMTGGTTITSKNNGLLTVTNGDTGLVNVISASGGPLTFKDANVYLYKKTNRVKDSSTVNAISASGVDVFIKGGKLDIDCQYYADEAILAKSLTISDYAKVTATATGSTLSQSSLAEGVERCAITADSITIANASLTVSNKNTIWKYTLSNMPTVLGNVTAQYGVNGDGSGTLQTLDPSDLSAKITHPYVQFTYVCTEHKYDSVTDADCNLCGKAREIPKEITVAVTTGDRAESSDIPVRTLNATLAPGEIYYAVADAKGYVTSFTQQTDAPAGWDFKLDNTKPTAELVFSNGAYLFCNMNSGANSLLSISGEGALKVIANGAATLQVAYNHVIKTSMAGGTTYTSVHGALLTLRQQGTSGMAATCETVGTLTFENANIDAYSSRITASGVYPLVSAAGNVEISGSTLRLHTNKRSGTAMKVNGNLNIANQSKVTVEHTSITAIDGYNGKARCAVNVTGTITINDATLEIIDKGGNWENTINKMPTTLINASAWYSENANGTDAKELTGIDENTDYPYVAFKAKCLHAGGTATCTEPAVCQLCGSSYGEAAGHSFTTKPSANIATAANCQNPATYFIQCDNCDAVSEDRAVPSGEPAGHSYTTKASDQKVSDADCTHAATYKAICDLCDEISETVTVFVGSPYGHSFTNKQSDELRSAADCDEKATYWVECNRCDAVSDEYYIEVGDALGHSYTAVVTAPTCTQQGYTTHSCSRCPVSYSDTYVAATGHTEQVIPAVAPTCTTTGLTEGKQCIVCNVFTVAQEVVAATGHTLEVIPGYAASCTEPGLSDGSKCTVCHKVVAEQSVIPAQGHTYTDVADSTCDRCGAVREVPQNVTLTMGTNAPTTIAAGTTLYASVNSDGVLTDKSATPDEANLIVDNNQGEAVMTLKSVSINATVAVEGAGALKILLEGENTININRDALVLKMTGGTTITSVNGGKLTATARSTSAYVAISASAGPLTFKDANVKLRNGDNHTNATIAPALSAKDVAVTVSGGNLEIENYNVNDNIANGALGISAGSLTIKDYATVTVTTNGGNLENVTVEANKEKRVGVNVAGDFLINNATLKVSNTSGAWRYTLSKMPTLEGTVSSKYSESAAEIVLKDLSIDTTGKISYPYVEFAYICTDHVGGTATCQEQAMCDICGAAYGPLADHTYDNDTDACCNVCWEPRPAAAAITANFINHQTTAEGDTQDFTAAIGEIWYATAAAGSLGDFSKEEIADWNIKLDNTKVPAELTLKNAVINGAETTTVMTLTGNSLKIIVDGDSEITNSKGSAAIISMLGGTTITSVDKSLLKIHCGSTSSYYALKVDCGSLTLDHAYTDFVTNTNRADTAVRYGIEAPGQTVSIIGGAVNYSTTNSGARAAGAIQAGNLIISQGAVVDAWNDATITTALSDGVADNRYAINVSGDFIIDHASLTVANLNTNQDIWKHTLSKMPTVLGATAQYSESATDIALKDLTLAAGTKVAYPYLVFTAEPYALRYTNLSLDGSIGLNLYFELSDFYFENSYRLAYQVGAEDVREIALDKGALEQDTDGTWIIPISVSAKQMNDQVKFWLVDAKGNAMYTKQTSVTEYAYRIMEMTDEEVRELGYGSNDIDYLKNLIAAMLNYGAKAQQYFGYNTDSLADYALSSDWSDAFAAITDEAFMSNNSWNVTQGDFFTSVTQGEGIESVSVGLDGTTSINVYFKLAKTDSIENYKFKVTHTEKYDNQLYYNLSDYAYAVADSGDADYNTYYVSIVGIPAAYLDLTYRLEVTRDGEKVAALETMVTTYIAKAVESDDEALKAIATSLYWYNHYANLYFNY